MIMKKFYSLIVCMALSVLASAANQEIEGFGKVADVVDLGLSVKWASWNIGASQVADYGGLYGAGDPTGLNTSTSDVDYYYKYGESICGTEYDLATVKWGSSWRMPTFAELVELKDRCSWDFNVTKDEVCGSVATGPNGNSIFIPYAFYITEGQYICSLWSGDMGTNTYSRGYKDLDIYVYGIFLTDGSGCSRGQSIRPVYVGPIYVLTYIVDGEVYKSFELVPETTITPEQAPTKEYFTFSGWSEIPATMPAHDVTVTGTFNVNYYKLTYIVDGVVYKTYQVAYGAAITVEEEPVREGYLFSGWSKVPATMPAHDVTVTGTFSNDRTCAKPTITYEDGELVFTCTTPGATCISTITVDDAGTLVGNRRSITATYFIKVYAMAKGYEDSPMTMALLCWMDDNSMPVNIEEVEMAEVKARPVLIQNQGSTLLLNGVKADTPVNVYDLNGRLMGSGTAMDGTTRISTKLTSGQVAIVRMGERSVKVKLH